MPMPNYYRHVQLAKTAVGKFNHYIFMSTDSENPNSYYLLYKRTVVARVYTYNNRWYIWFEQFKARIETESFTSAINFLEKEIVKKCTELPGMIKKR